MKNQPENIVKNKTVISRQHTFLAFRHRLFVKIMLVFAVTLITTIVANTVLTRQISRLEFQSENIKEQLQSLAQDAVSIYETSGEKSLQRWYMRQYQVLHIRILLLDKQNIKIGHSVGHHRMRAFMNEQYRKMHRLMPSTNMINKFWDSPPPIKLRWEVTSSLGNHYTMLVLPSPFLKQKWESSLNKYYSLRLFITFIILIIASFWLSRYVAKPVRKLKQASMQMAKGDLSVRVGHQIGSRKDELGELAMAFDEMAEKVERIIQQQKQLLTDISHEIKTPLTRQRLALSLARDNGASDDLLQKIETQNIKLAELIDSLLTLTRLDEGSRRTNKRESVPIVPLLIELINDAELEAKSKSIILHPDFQNNPLIDSQMEYSVTGDVILLFRAFENILRNALKYSPKYSRISIKFQLAQPNNLADSDHLDNQKITVLFYDEGPGIPEKDLAHIFTPFYRVDDARSQSTGGHGLGLAIVHRIITLHRGTISIKNRSSTDSDSTQSGLCVAITLPMEAPEGQT